MKRIDLVNRLHFIELDIRPSLIDKLAHELNKDDSNGDSYESICKMSEEDRSFSTKSLFKEPSAL